MTYNLRSSVFCLFFLFFSYIISFCAVGRAQHLVSLEAGEAAFGRRDFITALPFLEASARQGDRRAQYRLGHMYEFGSGVRQNHAVAVRWYRAAAEQGHARAQSNLASLYTFGRGVRQDHNAALRWYRAAAEQGDTVAQLGLGMMFEDGLGVPRDDARAYMWFSMAVRNGDTGARSTRDYAAQRLTSEQLTEAQAMFSLCISSRYENCGGPK